MLEGFSCKHEFSKIVNESFVLSNERLVSLLILHHWDFVFPLSLEHLLIFSPPIIPWNKWWIINFRWMFCLRSYHIQTQWHCFPSFRDVGCTINAIVKCIVHLLITGYITKHQAERNHCSIEQKQFGVQSERKDEIFNTRLELWEKSNFVDYEEIFVHWWWIIVLNIWNSFSNPLIWWWTMKRRHQMNGWWRKFFGDKELTFFYFFRSSFFPLRSLSGKDFSSSSSSWFSEYSSIDSEEKKKQRFVKCLWSAINRISSSAAMSFFPSDNDRHKEKQKKKKEQIFRSDHWLTEKSSRNSSLKKEYHINWKVLFFLFFIIKWNHWWRFSLLVSPSFQLENELKSNSLLHLQAKDNFSWQMTRKTITSN